MSLERRRELLELSHRHQVPVLEDDPYFELRYDGEGIPSLRSLDEGGNVLHLTTASKVLFPGLRLGWLLAPRPVVRQAALVKQTLDLHSNSAGQWILDRFIRDGYYEPHLERVRRLYARRCDAMDAALHRDAPDGLVWRKPEGGFYFWCRLPENVERSRLITRAADAGVSFLPGWSCYVDPPSESYVRLNFTYPPAERIPEGVARFLAAIRDISTRARPAALREGGTPPIV
jgi:DNA-binding transcriptional MocR family regulator